MRFSARKKFNPVEVLILWECEICEDENADAEDVCEEFENLRDEHCYDQITDEDDM
jgi:hypothetical protein